VDEGDEPWVEKLLGNGCFISIKNLALFIRVGIPILRVLCDEFVCLSVLVFLNDFLCFNRFDQKFELNRLIVFVCG